MGFQIIAFTILLLFYGCYFVKMLSQQRKGIQTDQIAKGKAGRDRWIETAMKAAACLAPTAEAAGYRPPARFGAGFWLLCRLCRNGGLYPVGINDA